MNAEKKIGVIGIGKLGLCFALNAERSGYLVTGVDVSETYVKHLNKKKFRSPEPLVNEYLQEAKNFFAGTDLSTALHADLIFVFVATPALPDGSYNHEQIERIAAQLLSLPKPTSAKHLVIGCTTMPGYCNTLAAKLNSHNYTVSYNPEFIAQGSIIRNQQNPDLILIGEENESVGNAIEVIHRSFCQSTPTVHRMDRLSAEIAKLATNCFLTTKISFANSIGDLAIKAGADVTKVLQAVGADSRIGNKYLSYGDGFGGPCFPRDNRALQKFADTVQQPLPLASATDKVNEQHLHFQIQTLLKAHKPDECIEIDGVAYKAGTVFIDESQRLKLALLLAQQNRKVIVTDRTEVIEQVKSIYGNLFEYRVK